MRRRRTAWLALLALAGFLALSLAIQRWIVYPQFTALQEAAVREGYDRMMAALTRETESLASFCADYAGWDDTWFFVETRDPYFLKANFTPNSFGRGNFHLVWIVAPDGAVLYRGAYDPTTGRLDDVNHQAGERILEGHAFLTALNGAPTSGVMTVAQGIALIEVHPILTSAGAGPPRGVLAMGRLMGSEFEHNMTDQVRWPVRIAPAHRSSAGLTPGRPQSRRLNTGEIETALLLNDWFGRPAGILTLRAPATIARIGQRALLQSAAALLGQGLLFVGVGGWLAHRRLRRSHEDQLARQLDDRTTDLRETENYLKTIMNTVPVGIVIVAAEGHEILDANPAALAMMDARREDVVERVCHTYICPAEVGRCPITDLGRSCDRAERQLLRPDGRSVPVLKTVVPTHLRGRACLLECFVDIRDRKQADETIRQTLDDMGRLNQAMIGREERALELKREVNDLLKELGRPGRYRDDAAPERTRESET